MPKASLLLVLAGAIALPLCSQDPPSACPSFSLDENIKKITPQDRIYHFTGGYVAIVNEVALDTDGSPVAYHPENRGTTHLCNGLDPVIDGKRVADKGRNSPCYDAVRAAIQANWNRSQSPSFCVYGFYVEGTKETVCGNEKIAWGGAFGNGDIPRQDANDPAPGFFISLTAAHNPGVLSDKSQAKYLDSDRTPYAVVPSELVSRKLLPRIGIAWAWNPKSGRTAAGVFGDTQHKFGEISIAFAQELEMGRIDPIAPASLSGTSAIPWPYGKTSTGDVRLRHSPSTPVVLVYFSKTPAPALADYHPNTIDSAAKRLLDDAGSLSEFEKCLTPLLH